MIERNSTNNLMNESQLYHTANWGEYNWMERPPSPAPVISVGHVGGGGIPPVGYTPGGGWIPAHNWQTPGGWYHSPWTHGGWYQPYPFIPWHGGWGHRYPYMW